MPRILREKDVAHITGLSRSTRWRLEKAKKFPRRIKLGGYSVGWRETDILEWINALPEKSENKA